MLAQPRRRAEVRGRGRNSFVLSAWWGYSTTRPRRHHGAAALHATGHRGGTAAAPAAGRAARGSRSPPAPVPCSRAVPAHAVRWSGVAGAPALAVQTTLSTLLQRSASKRRGGEGCAAGGALAGALRICSPSCCRVCCPGCYRSRVRWKTTALEGPVETERRGEAGSCPCCTWGMRRRAARGRAMLTASTATSVLPALACWLSDPVRDELGLIPCVLSGEASAAAQLQVRQNPDFLF